MDIEIRPLTSAECGQLVRCFERCYGATYPNESFYDAQTLGDMVHRGLLKSVVAVVPSGAIVGHTGLTLRHAGASATEAGNTVVDPDYRGQGILGRLGSALAELSRRSGFVGYVHYPTTAHSVMQTRSVANGGVETGVMLGYVPAATDYREIERPPGRIAATIVYQPFDPAPALSIYVPDRYQVLLGRLYGQMGLRRARLHSSQPVAEATEAASADSPGRGLLHIHVDRAGADIAAVVGRSMQASSAEITHVDLVLDDPGVDPAVNHLARLGFIYAGLLPGFARSDVLRLQHLRDQPASVFAPELANPDARSLLTLINSEHAGQPPTAGDPVHPGA